MRIEKGHAAGNELDGRTTALNLNMAAMVDKPTDHIGKMLARRPDMTGAAQVRMVGLKPVKAGESLNAGAHLIALGHAPDTANDLGWVSSAAWSPTFGHAVALGFLTGGDQRHGERLRAWDGVRGKDVEVVVTSPHVYDPEGGLQRA